jgi:AN1-type zinc finger and ubiquitin domain-containing protein 1
MYGLNKYMIDINIETLAGTTFSLKVSPLEAVQSVKAKIQRLEGIPISHQHLIWKSNELEDNSCLNDYNVPNGATIKLVLALRGGPINTRRSEPGGSKPKMAKDYDDL